MIEMLHKAAETIFLELENTKSRTKSTDVLENVEVLFK